MRNRGMKMELYEMIGSVGTKEQFVSFLQQLSRDASENKEEWESWTISDYLEHISAWIASDKEHDWSNVDYKLLATVLYVGKIYE